MMRSQRDTARTGHRGCRCCYPIPDNSTLRLRERQAWQDDYEEEASNGDDQD